MGYTQQEKQIVRNELLKLERNTGVPIEEVVNRISEHRDSSNQNLGGFVKYGQLIEEAKKQNPFASKDGALNNPFQSLVTASTEAIVYGALRDGQTAFGTPKAIVSHDPVAQGKSIINFLPQPLRGLGQNAFDSFGSKTPDIILISAPQTGLVNGVKVTEYPVWNNKLDLENPTSRTLVNDSKTIDKTLISPVEVTVTGDPQKIKKKIEKFKFYNGGLFTNNTNIRYVPVLVLDYDKFMENKDSQKKIIARAMKNVNGIIVLQPGLLANATTLAKVSAANISTEIRQHNKIVSKPNFTTQIAFATKSNIEKKSLLTRLLEKQKEWFQTFTQKSPSNDKVDKLFQKESAAETYKRVTSNIKSHSSSFQKIGVVNSDHIDLVIASGAIKSGLDPVELLKQSPTYQAKMPVLNKMWLNKMVHDAKGISEEAPDSANFQKAIKKYDAKKTKVQSNQQEATSTRPTKRLASEVYQEMTSSLKETASYPQDTGIDVVNNSNHLDLMLAKQLMKKDIDYETILRQSPNYRSKEPAEANSWLKNIIKDGISMNKEYYLDSDESQKIIRSYDNDASRPPEKSDFEKLSKSIQRYNSSYSTDRQGLLVAVAKAAIRAGIDPEQVLRQSPDYLLANSGKGETLVEKTVEQAESNVQEERSRAEQQARRDNQRDRGREL
jgi:hypothetical protein